MSETSGEFQNSIPKSEFFFSKLKNKLRPPTSSVQEPKKTEPVPSNDTDFDTEFKKLEDMLGPPITPPHPPESPEELILRLQKEEQEKVAILKAAEKQERADTQKLQEILNNHHN